MLRNLVVGLVLLALTLPASGRQTDGLEADGPALGLELGPGPVYIVPIDGMIDNALASYLERALADATEAEAALVLYDIDTFGGLVDAADRIRKLILDAPMPTIAFIDKNAASAGALISYAADRIVMVPGAAIGAATVVEGAGGEAAPDKYQSYMRGIMRTTAEANGRDPDIAEAMVDQDIEVPGVSEAGKVLTLSATEALKHKVADAIYDDRDALLDALGIDSERTVQHHASRLEQVFRFFGSPVVQSILMLMMLGGLYFELQTPGVGFAGTMAAIGAALFFGPNYMMGLAESWELLIFVLGVGLILFELFVTPGFGIAGVTGLVLIVASLLFSLIANIGFSFPSGQAISSAVLTLAATMVLFVVLVFSLSRYLPKSDRFGQLVLSPELSSSIGFTSADTDIRLLGRIGLALTPLRPAGMADFEGNRVDVITAGDYIEAGVSVKVISVRGSRVEVRRAPPETPGETLSA